MKRTARITVGSPLQSDPASSTPMPGPLISSSLILAPIDSKNTSSRASSPAAELFHGWMWITPSWCEWIPSGSAALVKKAVFRNRSQS